jgi:hypothetical protein
VSERLCYVCEKPITGEHIVIPRPPQRWTYWGEPKDGDPLPTPDKILVDYCHLHCRPGLAKELGLLPDAVDARERGEEE